MLSSLTYNIIMLNCIISPGQLEDLLHILDESGLPGPRHSYIFNGDFVDRGNNSVEVTCILLALHAALPGRQLKTKYQFIAIIV